MSSVRAPAVAGMFYPGEPTVLHAQLGDLLEGVAQAAPQLGFPKALIVPHAGYRYSGEVAARAYDEIAPARGMVRRVVLLGPVHRVPVRGLALSGADAFATPLGSVPLDREALRSVTDLPQVLTSDAAHALEHSLEVQLPFLQKVLGPFSLLPFAVGTASAQEVAEVIDRLWGDVETLIVVSTDLSHYLPYHGARELDRSTLERVRTFATDIRHEEACGATPLNGLLAVAKKRDLSIQLLAACNSGDTAGDKDQVVGYSALALYEGDRVSHADAGKALLSIARGSIEAEIFKRSSSERTESWLSQTGASFVTLTRAGVLRGCIGSLQAVRRIAEDVAHNALGAAFRDPRFSALTGEEWPQCSVEVSLLCTPKAVRFTDEEHLLAQLRPGEDGVIVEAEGRRASFLPRVWEDLPDKRRFMRELMNKAGLVAERLARCKVSRYRVTKWTQ